MTYRVLGRSGPIGHGFDREAAEALARVSGGTVEPEVDPWGGAVYVGPWWCPACSRSLAATLQTNRGEPCCPGCGGPLEDQGTGDDDPD